MTGGIVTSDKSHPAKNRNLNRLISNLSRTLVIQDYSPGVFDFLRRDHLEVDHCPQNFLVYLTSSTN